MVLYEYEDAKVSPISGDEMFYPPIVQNYLLYEFTRLVRRSPEDVAKHLLAVPASMFELYLRVLIELVE
jgi:hypothetical protein